MRYLKEPDAEPFETYSVPDDVAQTVGEIIENVESRGDQAVLEFTERFDGTSRETNVLTEEEIAKAMDAVSDEERRIIDNSIDNIRAFAEAQLDHLEEFETEIDDGIVLGQKILPIETVGAYVPGGEYPLLSSALMAVVPADVAGVDTITVATPPQDDGIPHPAAVYGAMQAGADDIYVIGGAQAIAAMATGTDEVSKVDKIVGPGNIFVTEAKRQVYGAVGIDLLAGPSEILVLADDTADSEVIASDLLAQAEHDVNARPLLVTTSRAVGSAVIDSVHSQLETLSTAEIARKSWDSKGAVIVVEDLSEAIDLSDDLAPEHLEVQVANPDEILDDLSNYGTLFLGEYSANVFSDKLIGTNHILPTQGAARYTSGLSVHKFVKAPTYQDVTEAGAASLEPWATKQARFERLEGHAKSSFIRAPDQELHEYADTTVELPEE